jgi:hypothetical protein
LANSQLEKHLQVLMQLDFVQQLVEQQVVLVLALQLD